MQYGDKDIAEELTVIEDKYTFHHDGTWRASILADAYFFRNQFDQCYEETKLYVPHTASSSRTTTTTISSQSQSRRC